MEIQVKAKGEKVQEELQHRESVDGAILAMARDMEKNARSLHRLQVGECV